MSLAQPSPRIIITLAYLPNHPIPSGIERFYSDFHVMKDIRQCPRPLVLPPPTSSLTPQLRTLFSQISIGFATQPARLDQMTGEWSPTAPSFTYHSDDGRLWANSFRPLHKTVYGEGEFGPGSTIVCGVVYQGGD